MSPGCGAAQARPVQELQGLLAVAHHVQPVLDLVILDGHEDVAFIVLHQQHVDYSRVFDLSHRLPRLRAAERRLLPG